MKYVKLLFRVSLRIKKKNRFLMKTKVEMERKDFPKIEMIMKKKKATKTPVKERKKLLSNLKISI